MVIAMSIGELWTYLIIFILMGASITIFGFIMYSGELLENFIKDNGLIALIQAITFSVGITIFVASIFSSFSIPFIKKVKELPKEKLEIIQKNEKEKVVLYAKGELMLTLSEKELSKIDTFYYTEGYSLTGIQLEKNLKTDISDETREGPY